MSPFTDDVFLSYAHVDNEDPLGTDKGWVDKFDTALTVCLQWVLGRKESVSVWRDEKKLSGHDIFDDEIADRIKSSAVLIAVLSPGYVRSTYCMRKELSLFGRTAEGSELGLSLKNKSRIFRVNLRPLRGDQLVPPFLEGMGGYDFQGLEGLDFLKEVEDLAHDIANFILEIKRTTIQRVPRGSGKTVYLAHATPDLLERREELKRSLKQYGITVLPDDDPQSLDVAPERAAGLGEVQQAIDANLRRAKISIHLMGNAYGEPLLQDPDNPSISVLQYDRAARAAIRGQLGAEADEREGENGEASGARVVVWTPNQTAVAFGPESNAAVADLEEAQRAFFRRLRTADSSEVEWLQQGLEDLKTLAHQRLGITLPTASLEVGALVLIACSSKARENQHFKAIIDCLYDQKHDIKIKADVPDKALGYNGLLILYLDSEPEWVEEEADKAKRLVIERGEARRLVAGIYDGPPKGKPQLDFYFHQVPTYPGRGDFESAHLSEFLQELTATSR